VDYRFIVTDAEDLGDACDKVDAMIAESTDEVWYTIAKVTKLQPNPNRPNTWQTCEVKWNDPRES